MNRYLVLFCMLLWVYPSKAAFPDDEIPPSFQNRKWSEVIYYEGQYWRTASEDSVPLFGTGIDSIYYCLNRDCWGDYEYSWKVEDVEISGDNVILYRSREDGDYCRLRWVDEYFNVIELERSMIYDEYNNQYYYTLVDSAFYKKLPVLRIDSMAINDVWDYTHYFNEVDDVIGELDVDYNGDEETDKIIVYKEYAYEDEINHSHRNYHILFFAGNQDGTFRADGRMYREVQKPGNLECFLRKDSQLCISISNIPDEEHYDPFTNMDAILDDFEKIKVVTDTYYYNVSMRDWILDKTEKGVTTERLPAIYH